MVETFRHRHTTGCSCLQTLLATGLCLALQREPFVGAKYVKRELHFTALPAQAQPLILFLQYVDQDLNVIVTLNTFRTLFKPFRDDIVK